MENIQHFFAHFVKEMSKLATLKASKDFFSFCSISSMFKQVGNNYQEPIEHDETIINPLLVSHQQGSGKEQGPLDFLLA